MIRLGVDLITALGAGSDDPQQIQNAIANLDGAQSHLLSTQAALGSTLAEIKAVQVRNDTLSTTMQARLTSLQSANLPQVLAQYSASITALQAAELAFAKIQNISLFSLIR